MIFAENLFLYSDIKRLVKGSYSDSVRYDLKIAFIIYMYIYINTYIHIFSNRTEVKEYTSLHLKDMTINSARRVLSNGIQHF